jgi:hypothetical protein
MALPFANSTDVLNMGTLYEPINDDDGGSEVENLQAAYGKDGKFIQADGRVLSYPLNITYLMHSGATLLTAGSTQNGYFIDRCTPGKTNQGHPTMQVQAHKRVNKVVTDTVVTDV